MREMEKARQKIQEKNLVAQKEEEQLQREFETLVPKLKTFEEAFWEKYIPQRLLNLFQEVRESIEEQEGFQMDEYITFVYAPDFADNPSANSEMENCPQHCLIKYSSGEEGAVWKSKTSRKKLVELGEKNDFDSIHIRGVTLQYLYAHQKDGEEEIHLIAFDFPSRYQERVDWRAWDCTEFTSFNWYVGKYKNGSCSFSDRDMNDFAEEMVSFLQNRDYLSRKKVKTAKTQPLGKEAPITNEEQRRRMEDEHRDQISITNEEQRRRMEDEHRDHVLHELEQRSAEDPNFVWPSSVPYEEKGMRRSHHDRLDNHSLQDGISHYFPEGPDR